MGGSAVVIDVQSRASTGAFEHVTLSVERSTHQYPLYAETTQTESKPSHAAVGVDSRHDLNGRAFVGYALCLWTTQVWWHAKIVQKRQQLGQHLPSEHLFIDIPRPTSHLLRILE